MDRWVSASSPGPPTRARWRSCSSAISAALAREPVLIVPNRSDVERVERDLLARSGALLGGSIGTFDDVFERIAYAGADARPLLGDAQRTLLVRRIVGGASLNGLGRSARFAGLRRLARGDVRGARVGPPRAVGDRGRPRPALRRLPRRARPARPLGPRRAAPARGRPAPVRVRRVERRAGLRVRLRGSDRRRVGAPARARRADGRDRLGAVRGRAHGVRVAAADDGRPERARGRADRGAAAAVPRLRASGARARRAATSSATTPAERAETGGAVRFFEGAGTRPTLELVGREILSLVRAGTAPEQIAIVCPALERWRAPLETGLGALGVPVVGRDAAATAADAVRARARRPAPLRLARRRPARALRLPAHAVLGRAAAEGGLPRGTSARPRDQRARPRRGRDARAARQPVPDRQGAARGADAARRPARNGRADAPPRVRPPPAAGERRGARSTCARTRRCRASRTSSKAGSRSAAR